MKFIESLRAFRIFEVPEKAGRRTWTKRNGDLSPLGQAQGLIFKSLWFVVVFRQSEEERSEIGNKAKHAI